MKVGIDMEDIARMNGKLLDKIATENEKKYVKSFKEQNSHIASLWCAKEAAVKILGTDISFLDVELLHEESGKPFLKLHGKAEQRRKELKLKEFDVSISHTSDKAIAIVIAN